MSPVSLHQVENHDGHLVITLVDHSYIQQVAHRILLLLMDQSDGSMAVCELCMRYQQLFGVEINMSDIVDDLQDIVKVSECRSAEIVDKLQDIIGQVSG